MILKPEHFTEQAQEVLNSSQEAVREYVDYLLSLCERHGVSTIAEHVEDEAHLESVKRLPIRYAQGYVFSPPLANVRSAKARH